MLRIPDITRKPRYIGLLAEYRMLQISEQKKLLTQSLDKLRK